MAVAVCQLSKLTPDTECYDEFRQESVKLGTPSTGLCAVLTLTVTSVTGVSAVVDSGY